MVSCKQCNIQNSLDSAFCKKCGATLDPNEIAIASEKLAAMVADGNRLFADGRTDDALMVAETAIASNPSSAPAVSLKGMCLERKGMIAEALECFERVVELEPNSTLDRLKVNDLKNILVVQKFEVKQGPNPRRLGLVAALAVVVLFASIGALFLKMGQKGDETEGKLVAMNGTDLKTFGDVMADTPANQQPPANQGQVQNPANNQSALQNPVDPQVNRPTQRENLNLPRYNGGPIPRPDEGGLNGTIGPVRVEIPAGGLPGTMSNNTKQPTQPTQPATPSIDPAPGILGGQSNTQADPPKNDPGIIEIEVSKNSGKPANDGGGEVAPTGNGRQALIATARSQMMAGNYSAAANTYERALRAGADPASTNQRLGQCYAQMGRNGDAVAAYTRAAAAFEKAGNTQGAEACRQAVKVLGG
jgi:tetratricopeptide (TPR) repeat protein